MANFCLYFLFKKYILALVEANAYDCTRKKGKVTNCAGGNFGVILFLESACRCTEGSLKLYFVGLGCIWRVYLHLVCGGNAWGCAYATGYLGAGPAPRLCEAYAQPAAF